MGSRCFIDLVFYILIELQVAQKLGVNENSSGKYDEREPE